MFPRRVARSGSINVRGECVLISAVYGRLLHALRWAVHRRQNSTGCFYKPTIASAAPGNENFTAVDLPA